MAWFVDQLNEMFDPVHKKLLAAKEAYDAWGEKNRKAMEQLPIIGPMIKPAMQFLGDVAETPGMDMGLTPGSFVTGMTSNAARIRLTNQLNQLVKDASYGTKGSVKDYAKELGRSFNIAEEQDWFKRLLDPISDIVVTPKLRSSGLADAETGVIKLHPFIGRARGEGREGFATPIATLLHEGVHVHPKEYQAVKDVYSILDKLPNRSVWKDFNYFNSPKEITARYLANKGTRLLHPEPSDILYGYRSGFYDKSWPQEVAPVLDDWFSRYILLK